MYFISQRKIIKIKTIRNIVRFLLFIFIVDYVFFPAPLVALSIDERYQAVAIAKLKETKSFNEEYSSYFPKNKEVEVLRVSYHTMTAYNSEEAQCDSSPCITANGFNVCKHGIEDTIAANFLRFGTKVRIPELFGDKIFIVRDRMNKRYTSRVDIWMIDKGDAKEFGRRTAKIEILK